MNSSATQWLVPIVVVATSAFSLAACSSSSSSSTSTTPGSRTATSAPTTANVSCARASADQVATAFGVQAIGPTSQANGAVTVCLYASSTNVRNVTIRYQSGMSASDFAAAESMFEDVPSLVELGWRPVEG